jgi:hypothetical protein
MKPRATTKVASNGSKTHKKNNLEATDRFDFLTAEVRIGYCYDAGDFPASPDGAASERVE